MVPNNERSSEKLSRLSDDFRLINLEISIETTADYLSLDIKGRLKTLIGDFQTTFVFAGWSVRILEIQFRFQPVGTRHADDGEAAVVLPALYLPVVFVEQVLYRAADGQSIFAELGFVARAYVNQGVGREGVLFLRILVRLAEV